MFSIHFIFFAIVFGKMLVSERDLDALIHVIAGDALSEGKQGMVAVAHVIENRRKLNKLYWGGK